MEHRLEILDRQVCFDGFLRLERYRLRHTLFNGEWGGELVRELAVRGRINSATSIIALQWLAHDRKRVRAVREAPAAD